VQERGRGLPDRPRTADIEIQQPTEGQVDLGDLGQVERVAESEQALDVGLVERERQAGREGGPIATVDLEERREAAVVRAAVHGTGVGHPATLARRRHPARPA
jgi:hypothetical protein